MEIVGVSEWEFDTSSTGSVGFALVSVSGGMIRLKKPSGGGSVDLNYLGVGGGPSIGIRFMPQGTFAPSDFISKGSVLKFPRCTRGELVAEDFLGPCLYAEVGAGLVAGGSGTLLFLGLPVINPLPIGLAPSLAKACVVMAGFSLVKNAGAGLTFSYGAMFL